MERSKLSRFNQSFRAMANVSILKVGSISVKTAHTSESYIDSSLSFISVTGPEFKPKIVSLLSSLVLT